MSADQADLVRLDATITFEDGRTASFAIDQDGTISRWGADAPVLGAIVELTEDVRRSLFDHLSLAVESTP